MRNKSLARLHFLDGLRGWGAVIVVLYHVCCDGLPINPEFGARLRHLPIFNGTLAVLIFFVVSGFSLSIRYLEDGEFRPWFRIAAGRYLRLAIPIFATCLIVHLAMVSHLIDPSGDRPPVFRGMLNFQPELAHLLRFGFLDVFIDYRHSESYAGPLWTMSIELAGSFLVLALILAVGRHRFRIAILFGASVMIALVASRLNTAMLSLFPLGATLAGAFERGWLQRIPVSVALALLIVGCAITSILPLDIQIWGAGAGIIVVACIAMPQTRALLSGKLSAWLGRLSFPLYLMHGPVMWLVGEPLMARSADSVGLQLTVQAVTILASFIAAMLFLPVNTFAIWLARIFGGALERLMLVEGPPIRKF